ncbi:MAG: PEGA domain-containing protein [Candidatus Komeilibacteria bacterium]|nr:PEGA domain-containing protein [Candidatus Komeilibacteria bacterium]
MQLKFRRILFLVFLVFFLVASPLLIIYALGYKFNPAKRILEKTGVFFIKSFPRSAEIYLNNQKYKKTTPAQIIRLLPGSYQLKITKEGYRPWQKNLLIQPDLTTFIEDVSLIYREPKTTALIKGNFSDFLESTNNEELALLEQTSNGTILWIYSINNDNFIQLYQTPAQNNLKLMAWSSNNKKILIKQSKDYLVFNAELPGVFSSLDKVSKTELTDIKWDEVNDNLIYGLKSGQLLQVNLLEETSKQIVPEKVSAYFPYKNKMLAIVKVKDREYLKIYNNQASQIIFSLPASADYRLASADKDHFILFNEEFGQLYLLEPANTDQPVKTELKNVAGFKWHDAQLIYWNSAELVVFYPADNQSILLERSGEKISNALWHPNAAYVYAVIGDKLKLYELDSRDQRNVYEITTLAPGSENFLATNKKGDYLYLIANFNNQPGLYKMEMQ